MQPEYEILNGAIDETSLYAIPRRGIHCTFLMLLVANAGTLTEYWEHAVYSKT